VAGGVPQTTLDAAARFLHVDHPPGRQIEERGGHGLPLDIELVDQQVCHGGGFRAEVGRAGPARRVRGLSTQPEEQDDGQPQPHRCDRGEPQRDPDAPQGGEVEEPRDQLGEGEQSGHQEEPGQGEPDEQAHAGQGGAGRASGQRGMVDSEQTFD
jgi:hypothetical protein